MKKSVMERMKQKSENLEGQDRWEGPSVIVKSQETMATEAHKRGSQEDSKRQETGKPPKKRKQPPRHQSEEYKPPEVFKTIP